jgi:CubicO group peptidase (beta-lactamase class C family)
MGYWWFSKLGIGNDYFMARGYGQQYIIVAPERELVLVLACKQEPRSAAEIDALLFLLDQKIMRAAPVSHRGADDSGPTPVLA